MASVVFAFGAKPGLPGKDALDLADLLSGTRTTAGNSAAEKIRKQARQDRNKGQTSEDVELDDSELEVLARVLQEEPWPREQEWFKHLRDQVSDAQKEKTFRVWLVHGKGDYTLGDWIYRGKRLPAPNDVIEVEAPGNPDNRRRARVSRIEEDHEMPIRASEL